MDFNSKYIIKSNLEEKFTSIQTKEGIHDLLIFFFAGIDTDVDIIFVPIFITFVENSNLTMKFILFHVPDFTIPTDPDYKKKPFYMLIITVK